MVRWSHAVKAPSWLVVDPKPNGSSWSSTSLNRRDHGPGGKRGQGRIASGRDVLDDTCGCSISGAASRTWTALRSSSAAAAASLSVAACTMANGASGPTASPMPRTSARPTLGSIGSVTRWRPPPRPTTASPSARASIAATVPDRSRCTAWRTGASGRWRSGPLEDVRRTAERNHHAGEALRRRARVEGACGRTRRAGLVLGQAAEHQELGGERERDFAQT